MRRGTVLSERLIAIQVMVPERDALRILQQLGASWPGRSVTASLPVPDDRERFGDIVVDPSARTVHRNGELVRLTPIQFELLLTLIRRRGAAISRTELLAEVWHCRDLRRARTVDTHVFALRRLLETVPSAPRYILTVPTIGYRLQD